ncbi:MAG: Blue-light-activated protein [Syntrophorhabdaceae bacterium PtaU1.Bin034]|jgi:signal transduction histidine kinase/DNA-binding response OmpR family regulator|nr:MAG: Blue-light-activated protein [Syntrophorhabdaceae bacterium PtaU1.Bin034]
MNKQLRLLIVEDSEDDALLVVRELRKAGYSVVYECVDSSESMDAALEREWDVIVADYVLPLFSGPAALRAVREKGIDLPFIVVSGNIGEDIAVAAMKAGAHDYILKSNLKRLVPAIERELRDAEVRRERRMAEKALHDTNTLLKLFTIQSSKKEYLDSVAGLLQQWTGCEAVGLRVLDKEANIPYESHVGFSDEFRESEHFLSLGRDHCVCPRVVAGAPDPYELKYMTPNGSFHCDDTMEFLSHLPDEAKARYRGTCMKVDYMSLCVIPVFYRNKILGAIHLADRAKGKVPRKTVEYIESIQPLIGEALHRLNVEEDRESLEAQLRRAQKLESIGILAGGIAHDFNNILAAIIGFSDMAREKVPPGDRIKRHLDRIYEAGLRGRDLVKRVLTFARQAEQEKKPLLMSSTIKETIKLLRATVPSTIDIHFDIKTESGLVLADPVQIQQLVMNLCTNAIYAMREKGGKLTIHLSDFSFDDISQPPVARMNPGNYIKLSVADTGPGIPPDIMEKIFDPFFTTKNPGEGTGLGLSVVHGILESHGGVMIVSSEPGKETVFTAYLPKYVEQSRKNEAAESVIPSGSERVLFVDDEETLAELGQELLTDLGYQVVCKTNGREALALFRIDPDRFDVIITDQTMPEMTGIELAKEIAASGFVTPVILCTGHSQMVDAEAARAAGIRSFVMKPLTKREIAKTVRQVLDENRA